MSLDATVYCDCYERGLASEPPMPTEVLPDGLVVPRGTLSLDQDLEFDEWKLVRMCEHRDGVLWTTRLGNMGLVAEIRGCLDRRRELFPILLEKVVYDGMHGGEFLDLETVRALGAELRALDKWLGQERFEENLANWMWWFANQMRALRELSLRVGKPITF